MPYAIETVESEGGGKNDLGRVLDRLGESRDGLQHMRGVESSRGSKVCEEVAVHHCNGLGTKDKGRRSVLTNAEANASESVSDGREPCQLGLVDGKMRRRGTEEALFVQNCLG